MHVNWKVSLEKRRSNTLLMLSIVTCWYFDLIQSDWNVSMIQKLWCWATAVCRVFFSQSSFRWKSFKISGYTKDGIQVDAVELFSGVDDDQRAKRRVSVSHTFPECSGQKHTSKWRLMRLTSLSYRNFKSWLFVSVVCTKLNAALI